MSDMELPVMRAPMESDPGPRVTRLVQPIASRFPAAALAKSQPHKRSIPSNDWC